MTDIELIKEILAIVKRKMDQPCYDEDDYDRGYSDGIWDVAEKIQDLIETNGYGNRVV